MINYTKTLQDDEGKLVHGAAELKEMDVASKARTAEVKPLEREKKDMLGAQLDMFKKILAAQTKALRANWGKKGIMGICQLRMILTILGIIQATYRGGNLNGKNVRQMFQESDKMVLQFQELLLGVDEEDGWCGNGEIINIIYWYSELCMLFDHLFSMARKPPAGS
jgi:hypothetical protein